MRVKSGRKVFKKIRLKVRQEKEGFTIEIIKLIRIKREKFIMESEKKRGKRRGIRDIIKREEEIVEERFKLKISRRRERMEERIFKRRKNIRVFRNTKIQRFKLISKKIGGKRRGDGKNLIYTRITLNKKKKIDIIIEEIRGQIGVI